MAEENITFYVKYGEGRAISVKTHSVGRIKREVPLITVDDLIYETKLSLPSALGSVDTDQLTLHATENGIVNEIPLDIDEKLSSIPSSYERKAQNPFVL